MGRNSIPLSGVIPYINCDIDDEDSLSTRFDKNGTTGVIDIAVIKLGRISNFTDFMALECIDGVNVRYVETVRELNEPDMVIIPGTKNTVGDLLILRENGLETRIKQLADRGVIVFGICGGYQMLGRKITDISGAETTGEYNGMGLIPIETFFDKEKKAARTSGVINNVKGILNGLSGQTFSGYEIHMGKTENGQIIVNGNKNVYGTYIHGIFDSKNVTDSILNRTRRNGFRRCRRSP